MQALLKEAQPTPLKSHLSHSTKGWENFENAVEEEPYPRLYQELIDRGTEALLERFKRYAHERRAVLKDFQSQVVVKKAVFNEDGPAAGKVVGVDAGMNGTNYSFAYIPLYGAVAVLVTDWKLQQEPICISGTPDIWPMEIEPKRRESLLHMALEYHIAKRAVQLWKPSYVILDGGIVLNPKLCPSSIDSFRYEGDFFYACVTALDLLKTCRDLGVVLTGFVKRTHMNHYGKLCKSPAVRDVVFLNPILGMGEYTEPFKVINKVTAAYTRLAEDLNYGASTSDIYSGYIKTGLFPYRVEVPSFCLPRLQDLMSLVYTTANSEGIPYPVYEADRYTRITRPTSNIHALVLFSKVLDLVQAGEVAAEDLDMLILQHGESWVLNDDGLSEATALELGRR